jgi:hypothetical protein
MFSYAVSRRLGTTALSVAVLLALGACSSTGGSTNSSVAREAGVPAPAAGAEVANPGAADSKAGASDLAGSANVVAPIDTKIIRTASIYLTVTSVETAAAAVRGVAAGLGGQVASETVNATDVAPTADPAPGGTTTTSVRRVGNYGQLVLSIPTDRLDAALDQLTKLGTVVQRASSSEDITSAYVDTESRITTKKASIERVRALMSQTQNISQIVELESQLAAREADLESLQAQLASMSKRVAMATITVTVSSNPDVIPPVEEEGFLAGLRSGWKAFQASLTVGLTVLGALLPWLIVIAVIGVPLRSWLRRRAKRQPVAPTGPPSWATPAASPAEPAAASAGPATPGTQGEGA